MRIWLIMLVLVIAPVSYVGNPLTAKAQASGFSVITSVTPNPATTTITLNGYAEGGASYDSECPWNAPYPSMVNPTYLYGTYRIDNGTDQYLELRETRAGQAQGCWGPDFMTTQYEFSQNINISSLSDGQHTIYVCVEDIWGRPCTSANFTKSPTVNPDFTISCLPNERTIVAGSSTSFNISTSPIGGFNSPVTISHTISPGGTQPTISYSPSNSQVPAATTTANVSTTTSTTAATYTIVFTGTGGGITKQCNVTLAVGAYIPPQPNYILTLNPASDDVAASSDSYAFSVTATCNNGSTGPIYNLAASSAFQNVTYQFMTAGKSPQPVTSVNCGGSVNLVVGNLGSIPANQGSTPQQRLGQTITVTGSGM